MSSKQSVQSVQLSSRKKGETVESKNTSETRSYTVERHGTQRSVNGAPMTLYNTVIQEKIVIEQVDTSGIRQAEELRHSVEDRYRSYTISIKNLLEWLKSVEKELCTQEILGESSQELHHQISSLKFISDELVSHSDDVSTTLTQIRQLVSEGRSILSTKELTTLDESGNNLKTRYDRAEEYTEQLFKKATVSDEEFKKYNKEKNAFKNWLQESCHTLVDLEKKIETLTLNKPEEAREFVSDVLSHKAELRFLEITANRFGESVTDYTALLNEVRRKLSHKLPALRKKESVIREELKEISDIYNDVKTRANKLFDRLAFRTSQKEFQTAVDKAIAWLNETTSKVQKILDASIGNNYKETEDLLSKSKTIKNEIVNKNKLVIAVTQAGHQLAKELPSVEATAVQTTMKSIEDKYENLLSIVNKRIGEIESGSTLINKIHENLKALQRILEKEEGRLPKSFMGRTPEEEQNMRDIVKEILRTLEANDSLMNTTRSFINELLRKGQGNEALRTSYVDIQDRWTALQKLCQERLGLSDIFEHFYELHESLIKFMKQSDKTLNEIGRSDSDSQLTQVKFVRQEMKSISSKLSTLNTTAETILKSGNPNSVQRQEFNEKVLRVNQRWTNLRENLEERQAHLESLMNSRQVFDKMLKDLETNLRKLSVETDDLASKTENIQPDEFGHRLNTLIKKLDNEKSILRSIEVKAQEIIEVLLDPVAKGDVNQKVTSVTRLFNEFKKKLDSLKQSKDIAERERIDFNDACAEAQRWIDALLSQLGKVSISADRPTLQGQVDKYEKIYADVLKGKPNILKIIQTGKKYSKFEPPSNLVQIQNSWTNLESEAMATRSKLVKCHSLCDKYYTAFEPFMDWLNNVELRLNSISLSTLTKPAVEKQLKDIEEIRREAVNRAQAHKDVRTFGEAFANTCDRDKAGVQRDIENLARRWDTLNATIQQRISDLKSLMEKLSAFNQNALQTRRVLDKCETDLDKFGEISQLKIIGDELARLDKPVEEIQHSEKEISKIARRHECGSDGVQNTVQEIYRQHDNLKSKLKSRLDSLKGEEKALDLIKQDLSQIFTKLGSMEMELENMKPIGRDIATIQKQIKEITEFIKRVVIEQDDVEQLVSHMEQLRLKGHQKLKLKPEIDGIKKRLSQLKNKADTRSNNVESTLKELTGFYDSYKITDKDLDRLLRICDLNESIRALDEFRKVELTNVGKRVERVNVDGRRLVKSATYGIDTSLLETDLKILNEKWKLLNDKVEERRLTLEGGAIKRRQFEEARVNFFGNLRKIESLLSDDGRIHGDLDTVKGLFNQHNKIKNELEDRRTQLQHILSTVAILMESTSSVEEKSKISSQADDMKEFYGKIKGKYDDRSRMLDSSLQDAEKLNRSVLLLLDWLSEMDKKKRGFPEISPQLDDVQAQKLLNDLERFSSQFEGKSSEKESTLVFSKAILAKAHPNAVPVLKNWISSIQTKWEELSNWISKRRQKLQEIFQTLRDNHHLLNEIFNWLKKREDILTRAEGRPLPDDVDEILLLIKEHTEFMEVTEKRQEAINSACELNTLVPRKTVGKISPQHSQTPSPRKELKPTNLFPKVGPHFELLQRHESKVLLANTVWSKWKEVWTLSWERQRRLKIRYEELTKRFSWDDWRRQFLKFMKSNKERIKGLFTKYDRKNLGLIPRSKFIEAIVGSEFSTTEFEVGEVASMFENGNYETDYLKFMAALRLDWEEKKPLPESKMINDEIQRQVKKCTCKQKFRVDQVAEGTYRFGDSQKLRLVRILRSTVMVRVGGGWETLEEFLLKNDPCRIKGRTNVELREQLNTPEGASEILAAFTAKRKNDPNSRTHSPSPVRQPEKGIWKPRSTF